MPGLWIRVDFTLFWNREKPFYFILSKKRLDFRIHIGPRSDKILINRSGYESDIILKSGSEQNVWIQQCNPNFGGFTICPRSSDPFHKVSNYIKWVSTS